MSIASYYYLDEENKPRGPFSLEQIAALFISGTIKPETLVAMAGEDQWKAVQTQSWYQDGQIVTSPVSVNSFANGVGVDPGKCSYCHHEIKGWSIPLECPTCKRRMRPVSDGFFSAMAFAFRNIVNFRGRATRQQYWAFFVGMIPFLLLLVLGVVAIVLYQFKLILSDMPLDQVPMAFSNMLYTVCMMCIIPALFCLPMYVRRMHDIGLSGKWIITAFLLIQVAGFVTFYQATSVANDPVAEAKAALDELETLSFDTPEDKIEAQELVRLDMIIQLAGSLEDAEKSYLSPVILGLNIFTHLFSIWIFVMGFIDSKRGPNKFGPSLKYPRG